MFRLSPGVITVGAHRRAGRQLAAQLPRLLAAPSAQGLWGTVALGVELNSPLKSAAQRSQSAAQSAVGLEGAGWAPAMLPATMAKRKAQIKAKRVFTMDLTAWLGTCPAEADA
jgi:hypothetical protein